MLRSGWVTVDEICYLLGVDKSKKEDVKSLLRELKIPTQQYKANSKNSVLRDTCYYSLTELEECIKLMLC